MDCLHLEDEEEQNEPLEALDEGVADAQWEDEPVFFLIVVFKIYYNPLQPPQSNAESVRAHGYNRGDLHQPSDLVKDVDL
jgi:hypothetical protein